MRAWVLVMLPGRGGGGEGMRISQLPAVGGVGGGVGTVDWGSSRELGRGAEGGGDGILDSISLSINPESDSSPIPESVALRTQ